MPERSSRSVNKATGGSGREGWVLPGLVYSAIVFAVGFVFGAIRNLWLTPVIGLLAAVAIELPFMLTASWLACGWCMDLFLVSGSSQRAWMGGLGFLFLMLGEALFADAAFGLSISAYAAEFLTTAGILGLAGQIAFALFPLFHPAPSTLKG